MAFFVSREPFSLVPLSDDSPSERDSDSDELLEELSSELDDRLDWALSLDEVSCFNFLWLSPDTSGFFGVGSGDGDLLGTLTLGLLSPAGDVRLSAFLGFLASLGGLPDSRR